MLQCQNLRNYMWVFGWQCTGKTGYKDYISNPMPTSFFVPKIVGYAKRLLRTTALVFSKKDVHVGMGFLV